MMATETFEQSNIGWKLQQLQQKVSEGIEFTLNQFLNRFPKGSIDPYSPNLDLSGWGLFLRDFLVLCFIALTIWAIWRITKRINLNRYFKRQSSSNLTTISAIETNLAVDKWLARSQQFQQQGDYYNACRCLYLAMLQHLDDQRLIVHQSSRTDQEYRELVFQNVPNPYPYYTLFTIHQQLCFAQQTVSFETVQEAQTAYQEMMKY